ncbi:MAG: DUF2164 domain-containing protein [Proteobacteria bacterium]|nr:DUF2164 domain-containing protein [Pseudomonadota bacterium]
MPFVTQPMRIKLSAEAREKLIGSLQRFLDSEYEVELSDFQTAGLLDFLVHELGAPVYNQAIQDARRFIAEKLDDLEGEFYEPEEPS